jgi:hypothetical protein
VDEIAAYKSGLETPLGWDMAIKAGTLCLLSGLTVLLSGYSLGEVAKELISFFGEYDDDEKQEATTKVDNDPYVTGSAAQYDLIYHLVTALMGWFVLTTVAVGGEIF